MQDKQKDIEERCCLDKEIRTFVRRNGQLEPDENRHAVPENCCDHEHGAHGHRHAHDESCGCGHDHEHAHTCADRCGGAHNHAHAEDCGCQTEHVHVRHRHVPGHPADCRCEQCYPHEDYCDVCGKSLASCTCRMPDADKVKRVYVLKNLGCANCAAKMEHKIRELPGVTYANISFVTKQLRLSAADHDKLLPQIQEICSSIESEVVVEPRQEQPPQGLQTRVYKLEHLGCANCAAKMEREIRKLPAVTEANKATLAGAKIIFKSFYKNKMLF